MDELKQKWNARYREQGDLEVKPCQVLSCNAGLLPDSGVALDLACGRGGNALFLASQGLRVTAWDISDVAIEALQSRAREAGLDIDCSVRDVSASPPAPASFDVIVVSYFLDRDLTGPLQQALKPGGLLYYQTFSGTQRNGRGPSNPAYRLKRNELLKLFSDLNPVFYDESGQDIDGECQFIARNP